MTTSIKAKIARLEARLGGRSTKHYLLVSARHGESQEAAIDRHLHERGITKADVGAMWVIGDDFCETIDYKNYARKEDLIGWREAETEIRACLEACAGKSLGPPSLRPGYTEERRHEERSSSGVRGTKDTDDSRQESELLQADKVLDVGTANAHGMYVHVVGSANN